MNKSKYVLNIIKNLKRTKTIFNANKKKKERLKEMIQTDSFQYESVMKP